ncbi:MAG: PQQ-dependent sugar dehydrogenase [Acidimicrobiia bacterium]|nr:PQQ-dependent sugar dehydrogenase [Acidimicrobiia bacterium]
MRARSAVATLAALGVVLAGCGDDEPTTAPTTADADPTTTAATDAPATGGTATAPTTAGPAAQEPLALRLTEVATVDAPSALRQRPGTDELWVAERSGSVRLLDDDEVLDISGDVGEIEGERGLLGLEFSAAGDRLYLGFTEANGDVRLDEWAVGADGGVDEGSRRTLADVEHRDFANHNGGNVVRGPDDALYFGVGDGGSADDPQGNAQNPDVQLGKLLRVDADSGDVTTHAIGLRNPWRFSFDRENGDLWLADVGQNMWEEVDHVPFADLEGANFGWDRFEGTHRFEGQGDLDAVVPVFELSHDDGDCSITGGYRYRGTAIPALVGHYVFGDYCGGQVRVLAVDDGGTVAEVGPFDLPVPQLVSFAEDLGGELYALSLEGGIFRIDAG